MAFNIDPRWLNAAARMTPLRTLADIVAATGELNRNSRARPLLSTAPAAFATKPARPAAQSARPAAPRDERRQPQPQPQTRPRSGSSPRPSPPPLGDRTPVQPDPFGRRYSLLLGSTGLDGPRRDPLEAPPGAEGPLSLDNLGRNRHLGSLSSQEETSGKGPGTVSSGKGDPGGISYGSYQLATNMKQPQAFLKAEGLPWSETFSGLQPTDPAYAEAWRRVAAREPERFALAQHDYIDRTHYQPQVQRILDETGVDVRQRSLALQEAIWSTAVQHGPSTGLVVRAISAAGPNATEAEILRRLYASRATAYPPTAPRYERELDAALSMLDDAPPLWSRGGAVNDKRTGTNNERW